jgi:hypothetical protein
MRQEEDTTVKPVKLFEEPPRMVRQRENSIPTGVPMNVVLCIGFLRMVRAFSGSLHARVRSIVPYRPVADIAQHATVKPTGAVARLIDEIVDKVVGVQEHLDALPRLVIAHAFAIKNCGAVREVVTVCSFQETGLHALRVEWHRMVLLSVIASRFHSSKRLLRSGLSKRIRKMKTAPS